MERVARPAGLRAALARFREGVDAESWAATVTDLAALVGWRVVTLNGMLPLRASMFGWWHGQTRAGRLPAADVTAQARA
jgi:hypothetical protein